MEMAPIILVYLFYSMVGMAHLAPIDGELQEFFVHHRVKRAKVELPLDIFDVTRWHNYFRRKPIASDMEHVHHSQVLADRALWWARKCRFDYVPPEDHRARGDILRTTLSPLFATYGQNIYHTSKLLGDNELIREALSSWYDESRVYLPDDATCLIGSCRLYKQLMWASVQAVGCAAIRCDRLRDPFGNNYANELFLVCNYNRQ
ncbi:hypothetical protein LSH36_932g01102 [Paralvinella palmiformis]|uniref:SCP domain-containing protein n=1 Tax=Paralvinella palmiformis TaxID=53620 RepID=A0AAD9MSL5_9ANNE|nr:hypothetical protein LSH36_932g01102 [Paralvinella palmiformis]